MGPYVVLLNLDPLYSIMIMAVTAGLDPTLES